MARSNSATAEQRELVLRLDRVFDAPRDLVWRLWRDPEHMVRWHGPEGFALLACELDFRVGGKWRRCMSNGPGHEHWIHGEYLEIEEPSRLSFTYVNDADGFETVVTMAFLETGDGRTRMLFEQTPFLNRAERDGHGWGWNSGFNTFANYLLLFKDDDWSPKGPPRRDGVAEDFADARQRQKQATEEEAAMQTEPKIIELEPRPYVAVRRAVTIPFGDVIPGIMDTLFSEVNAQGLQPDGPVFFKYNFINMPDLEIDFGVTLQGLVPVHGELVSGVIPAGRYVQSVYHGHYDNLIEATRYVIEWARDQGIRWDAIETPDGDTFVSRLETYPNGPDDEPDPDKWETIIEIKIRD